MQELIIGLSSNLGNRRENLEKAIKILGEKIGPVLAVSSFIETEPWGFISNNLFLNGALKIGLVAGLHNRPVMKPSEILGILNTIESDFGRIRTGQYADRIIDLDILFYGNEIINEPGLIIPHPKLHLRDFVLMPLMEICPDQIHPVFGKTVRELSLEKGSAIH